MVQDSFSMKMLTLISLTTAGSKFSGLLHSPQNLSWMSYMQAKELFALFKISKKNPTHNVIYCVLALMYQIKKKKPKNHNLLLLHEQLLLLFSSVAPLTTCKVKSLFLGRMYVKSS